MRRSDESQTRLGAACRLGSRSVAHRLSMRAGFSKCRIDPATRVVTRLTRDGHPGGPVYAAPLTLLTQEDDVHVRQRPLRGKWTGKYLQVARARRRHRLHQPARASGSPWSGPARVHRNLLPWLHPIGGAMPYLFILSRGKRQAGPRRGGRSRDGRLVARANPHRRPEERPQVAQSICLLRTNTDFHCERDVAVHPSELWGPAGSPERASASPPPLLHGRRRTRRPRGSTGASRSTRPDGRARPQSHPSGTARRRGHLTDRSSRSTAAPPPTRSTPTAATLDVHSCSCAPHPSRAGKWRRRAGTLHGGPRGAAAHAGPPSVAHFPRRGRAAVETGTAQGRLHRRPDRTVNVRRGHSGGGSRSSPPAGRLRPVDPAPPSPATKIDEIQSPEGVAVSGPTEKSTSSSPRAERASRCGP